MKSLVSKGVLEVRRGSGTYVVSTSSLEEDPLGLGRFEDKYHLALELFEVRLMLEPEIASLETAFGMEEGKRLGDKLIAAYGPEKKVTILELRQNPDPEIAALASEYASEEEKAQLESLCDQVERQYTAGINHIKKDIEFHTCIAKCSRNRVVEILIPLINSSVSTFATLTRRQLMKETIETHRAVTNAILKGDSVGARCAMIMHLTYNRQKLLELLEDQEKDWEGRKEGE